MMSPSNRQLLSQQLTRKVLLLSVLGVLGLVSTIVVTLSRQLLSVQRELEAANAIAAGSFDRFFLSLQSDLTSIASMIEYSDDIDQNLRDFLARHPGLQGVRFIDANGELVAHRSTFSYRSRSPDGLPEWARTSPRVGDVLIGRVEYSGPQPFTEIVTPVTDDIGIPKGFLIARIDLTNLLDIALDIRVGQTGYAYLVDEEEHVIARRAQYSSNSEISLTELIGKNPQMLVNESLSVHRGIDGEFTFSTARPLQLVPWYSIVEQPAAEALKPFSFLAILLILNIAFVVYLLKSAIQFTHLRISLPLRQLSQSVAEMRQGKPFQTVDLDYEDELKELVQLLSKITQENTELYDSLEAKVRKRTQELEISNQKAEAANRSKSEFLAHMTHELRTPLNSILGFSDLLKKDGRLSVKQSGNLEIINRSGEYLLNLINNILEMSKIEAGQSRLIEKDVDLICFLNDLSEMMRINAQVKQLNLSFLHSPELPTFIRVDEGKLRQILLNLLANAIKFTDQGEVKLEVSSQLLNWEARCYKLSFAVIDTGPGIAPDDVDNLFSPFSQAKLGHLSRQGTGLGLSISQRFAQLMGSQIGVRSQVGQGSQFFFELDVTAVDSQMMVERSYPIVRGLKPSPIPYRILVVDDLFESCMLMEQRLSEFGFDVREANSGEEAIQQQQEWLPHLIWMDIRLPGISGLEATRHIKQQPNPPIIIALTANAFVEDRELAIAAGCDDFVAKPCTDKVIWRVLHDHLNLEYQYSPKQDTKSDTFPEWEDSTRQAGIQQLQQTSPLVREALKQAARSLSEPRITQVMEKIPPQKVELHSMVSKLVQEFQYDRLLEIIIQCESSKR